MKYLSKIILVLLLLPSFALAQSQAFKRNDLAATTLQNTNLQPSFAAVNSKGRLFTSTTIEPANAVVSGTLDMTSTLSAVSITTNSSVSVMTYMNYVAQTGNVQIQGSYDNTNWFALPTYAAVAGAFLSYDPLTSTPLSNGYGLLHTDTNGIPFIRIKVVTAGTGSLPVVLTALSDKVTAIRNIQPGTTAASLGKAEDAAHASGDTGVLALAVREDALTFSTSASGDNAAPKTDSVGRLMVASAPVGETFNVCSNAATATSQVSIKASVASNTMNVTSVTCKNSSTVPSGLTIQNASTALAVGSVTAVAVGGSWTGVFPTPLRVSLTNNLNFFMDVTGTSTICCAQGYISVQ